ncbi:hypothetical protein VTI28DRAFT_7566 [Corynascus sepedonium]
MHTHFRAHTIMIRDPTRKTANSPPLTIHCQRLGRRLGYEALDIQNPPCLRRAPVPVLPSKGVHFQDLAELRHPIMLCLPDLLLHPHTTCVTMVCLTT